MNKKYLFLEEIGKGSTSNVYKVFNIEDKNYYACKKLCLLNQLNTIDKIKNELFLLELVSNDENFIKMIEYFFDDFNYYIIMELANNNIRNYIKSVKICDENFIKNIFNKIFLAIKKLHQINILHGDLKIENILYKINYNFDIIIKISDFGLSRIINNDNQYIIIDKNDVYGTIEYMSPELIRGVCCLKNDIYALGKILFKIFIEENYNINYNLVHNNNLITKYYFLNIQKYNKIRNIKNISIYAIVLINKMLENNYSKRFDIYDCINSKWMNGLN